MKEEIIDKFINNMNFPPVRYDKPFIVTMSGYSGSGKSYVARVLSSELGLYIVSGDHVRQEVYNNHQMSHEFENVQAITNEICDLEIKKLLENKISIVIDRSISSVESLNNIKNYGVKVYTINIKSDHEQNIERICRCEKMKINITPVYGDSNHCSGMNSREVYDEVRNRKLYDIDDNNFDYHIDGTVSLVEEIEQARKIAHNIAKTNKKC